MRENAVYTSRMSTMTPGAGSFKDHLNGQQAKHWRKLEFETSVSTAASTNKKLQSFGFSFSRYVNKSITRSFRERSALLDLLF